jgi:hypothetical protein
MNIVTSVGYGDMFGTTDTERITICLIILTGDALFAVAFGMMASIAAGQESEVNTYLNDLKDKYSFLTGCNITEQLRTRLENFYAYKWALIKQHGSIDM